MDITQRKMTKIAREVNKFTLRVLRTENIGSGELDFIHAVRHHPGATQAELCAALGSDKGAAARQTARLERKGYLVREKSPSDGRCMLLYATEKADSLKNSKAAIEAAFYEWLTEALSESDGAKFAELLDELYRRCRAESKAGFPNIAKRVGGAAEKYDSEEK